MIKNSINESVFYANPKHIAFAVSTEGKNEIGFAGDIAEKYWPELADCGEHELGDVLTKQVGDKTFYALVCYSITNGWGENQDEVIKKCFDNIPVEGDVPISTIAIGGGRDSLVQGSDFRKTVYGMDESEKQIILHSKYSMDKVRECCDEVRAMKSQVKR